ncbi:MAG: amidohydrolase family protein [Actinomycetes bacterium]
MTRDSGLGTGVALAGRLWRGGDAEPLDDAVVVVDRNGDVAAAGPATAVHVPDDVRRLVGAWVGPGVVDAHVHLAFADPVELLAGGVVAARDLGAPPALVAELRARSAPPVLRLAGPLLTAPGGYPTRSWGADGFAVGLHGPEDAAAVVRRLAADGVDVVKVAVEPAGGLPVPTPAELAAVVRAAHDGGLRVTAHALTAAAVERVLDAGVDELAHTPVERLPEPVVHRIAAADVPVVSTLQTLVAQQDDDDAPAANARALVTAGVPLVYGSDLDNAGTRPGVDPRELDRLAEAGLGRAGALRAATDGSARLLGLSGRVEVGQPAALVLLPADPLEQPEAWRAPLAVLAGGRLLLP